MKMMEIEIEDSMSRKGDLENLGKPLVDSLIGNDLSLHLALSLFFPISHSLFLSLKTLSYCNNTNMSTGG